MGNRYKCSSLWSQRTWFNRKRSDILCTYHMYCAYVRSISMYVLSPPSNWSLSLKTKSRAIFCLLGADVVNQPPKLLFVRKPCPIRAMGRPDLRPRGLGCSPNPPTCSRVAAASSAACRKLVWPALVPANCSSGAMCCQAPDPTPSSV